MTNVSEDAIRYALKAYEVEPETAVMDEIATGDPETATHWLERAAAQPRLRFGEDRGAELKPDQRLDVLRTDPRYHRLLKKLELI